MLMFCLIKKIIRDKMKRIQSKLHKVMKFVNLLYLVLMIKDVY